MAPTLRQRVSFQGIDIGRQVTRPMASSMLSIQQLIEKIVPNNSESLKKLLQKQGDVWPDRYHLNVAPIIISGGAKKGTEAIQVGVTMELRQFPRFMKQQEDYLKDAQAVRDRFSHLIVSVITKKFALLEAHIMPTGDDPKSFMIQVSMKRPH